MTYKSEGDRHTIAVEQARVAVGKAMQAHSKGGSADAVNKATKELNAAHSRYQEYQGLNVPDER